MRDSLCLALRSVVRRYRPQLPSPCRGPLPFGATRAILVHPHAPVFCHSSVAALFGPDIAPLAWRAFARAHRSAWDSTAGAVYLQRAQVPSAPLRPPVAHPGAVRPRLRDHGTRRTCLKARLQGDLPSVPGIVVGLGIFLMSIARTFRVVNGYVRRLPHHDSCSRSSVGQRVEN